MENNTNSTNNLPVNTVKTQLFLAYYAVLLVTTVLGNTLVCLAIYLDRRLRSSTNWFVASLAVSDLLYGLVGLPFRIAQTSGTVFELRECYIWVWVDMVCAAASIANLALISIDRYIKITKPFQYHVVLTQPRAFIAVGSIWVYSGVLASFALVRWPGAVGIVHYKGSCINFNEVFYTVAMIVAFILPLVILVINYAKVFVEALKQFNKMVEMTAQHSVEKGRHNSIIKDFKATKTLAVVIGTFTICWCPFFILFTIAQYKPSFLVKLPAPWNEITISMFFFVLPNVNSALNPFIYAYFNNDFRRAFKKIMTWSVQSSSWTAQTEVSQEDSGRRLSAAFSSFLHSKYSRPGRHSGQNNSLFQNNNPNEVRD
ncbi:5-hydroxytryptamine receptor 1 [Exaiptasia diaphana]|uniref:G-protein coupled receptors family 1 profile domain-containing protein n=1 Tax=Exaiptasia diaphana TaxID=2652724 RepID=A0A913YSQ0_EXADI|nr:5-hydroxytryptamine receptor 1 [Exaiptasia diaphana]XP_028518509.1 5-hydroxytryptamine receptor 1 [Exaiptasia diaphana]XP_028518510.1 5-hydroxytryptamine receptor 1 [Exaiptasia diaphana]XP_028518511.1 5-hydroxytryptamine receptor 1 [Exaiptasia diaphana]XP_028518512.1 5-hydroxytryptamine receptor 1 [Exaiptasia diaphana]XP_028518513.1 5-hydroxytryptamine receptor 1 [Exaiptasia diaphana]XP_028518514.1 5-hydroxytryptamine receptor 1 [Exaiptasia diaphana]